MIWYTVYKDRVNIKKYLLFLAFIAFLVVNLLATIFGVNIYHSIFGNFERMDGLLHLISLALYFLLLINTFKTTKDWLWIFRTSIITALVIVAYEVFGRIGWIGNVPIPHSSGTIGNTLFLGSYLMFNIFFSLMALYIDRLKSWRIFYLVSILINVVFLFINASRSSIVGLVVGIGLLMLLMFFKVNKKLKILFISALLALVIFVGLVINQRDSAWVQDTHFLQRMTSISTSDFSTMNRLLVWQVSLEAFYDRPILGYGPENVIYGVDKHYNPEVSEQWFDRAHNFLLDHLLNAGILGLASFLAIFVLAFRSARQYLKKHYFLGASLMGLLVAYMISNLFTFDSLVTWLPLILTLAFIDFLAAQDKEDNYRELPLWLRKGKKYILLLVLLLFGGYAYCVVVKPTQANKVGLLAAMYSQVDIDISLDKFKQAFDYNTYGNYDIARALGDMAKLKMPSEEISIEDKEKIVLELEREITIIISKDPANVRMRMILADIYLDFSNFDKSYADKAISITEPGFEYSPERLELHAIMARAYMLKKDFNKALNYLEESLAIYDDREQDYMNVFYMLYQQRDKEKFHEYVVKYLARFEDISVESYNVISRYYVNFGEGQKLLDTGIVQVLIDTEPDILGHRIMLLDAYYGAGLHQEALDYINEISKDHPDWAEDLGRYWELIQD